jgi:LEA14-like dessication related protein
MPRLRAFRAASLAVALLLAGCGSVIRQPKVTLENVQIGGLGLRGGTLLVNVRVENPNGFTLSANQFTYDLAIRDANEVASTDADADTAWIEFASGTYDEPFSVAGHETRTVQVPIEFSYSGLGSASSALLRNGTFTYRARGTVDVKTPLGTQAVPFTKRGTFSMMGSP